MYEPIADDELSYVKMINMQSKVICNHIYGNMAHLLTPFLMSIHIVYVGCYASHCCVVDVSNAGTDCLTGLVRVRQRTADLPLPTGAL